MTSNARKELKKAMSRLDKEIRAQRQLNMQRRYAPRWVKVFIKRNGDCGVIDLYDAIRLLRGTKSKYRG